MFKRFLKVEIINADKIAKDLTSEHSEYLSQIVRVFGEKILKQDNTLDRKALASIIYNDIKCKEELDKLTFEFVCKKIENEIEVLRNQNNIEIVLIDAPLLIESGLEKICDCVIAVIADKQIKINRICARDNIDIETANKRLSIQNNDKFYISKSNFVITNNSENGLEEQVEKICNKL